MQNETAQALSCGRPFNIYAPGDRPGSSTAMYIAASNGLRYEGTLPENGDYLIQVFINRNAARRNESTNYTLNVSIGGDGAGLIRRSDRRLSAADRTTAFCGETRRGSRGSC